MQIFTKSPADDKLTKNSMTANYSSRLISDTDPDLLPLQPNKRSTMNTLCRRLIVILITFFVVPGFASPTKQPEKHIVLATPGSVAKVAGEIDQIYQQILLENPQKQ